MAVHSPISDAQRAMASALLWHFEDEDVREENNKLRAELINSQQERARLEEENRGLVANVVTAGQEQEKAQLETTAWRNYIIKLNGMITGLVGEDKPPPNEKLDDTIIRRIRNCCVSLKQVTTSYKNVATENGALQARVAELERPPPAAPTPPTTSTSRAPPEIPARPLPPENDAMLEDEERPVAPDSASSTGQVTLAVDLNGPTSPSQMTASPEVLHSSVSQAGPPPTPVQSSSTSAPGHATHPPSVPTSSAPSVIHNSAPNAQSGPTTPKKQKNCHCPPFVALSPAQSAALNEIAEPARARDWMKAVFDTPKISQQEVYNAYQALGPAADILHPAHLFALFKTVFPSATTARTAGPNGEAAYMMCGVARKRAPCVCGVRAT